MRIFSWRALLPLLLMVAMVAALACSSDNADDATADATGTAAGTATGTADTSDMDAEQVLNVNLTAEPESLDPQRATDSVSLTVLRNLYAGLLRLDPNDEVQPYAAKEVPTVENGGISADGLTYTFKLRDDLKWSDGTPLVAQAFVDGAKHLFEPGSENYYVDFYRIIASKGADGDANIALEKALSEGVEDVTALEQAVVDGLMVEAPDDHTVVYHLNRKSPVFLLLSTMWPLYPIRQDLLEANGDQWTEAGKLVSNGAFSLAKWNHTEDLQLVKNEHFFGESHLDVINMDMIDDAAVAYLAYQNNELDAVVLGPAELVQVRSNAAVQEEFHSYAQLVTLGLYLNNSDPLLSDVRVRQALSMALDRNEYANVVLEGNALPAFGWVPPGMPGYDETVGLQFDNKVDDAKKLLAEAGAEGAEITVLTSQSSTSVLTGEWLKQQWESKLGLKVTLNSLETATYFSERNAGNFQVVSGGWGADYPDPQNWLPLFRTGSGLNSGKFANAEYDKLLDQAEAELDNDKRIALYVQAQKILIDEVGFAPLNYRVRGVLVKPWVKGVVYSSQEGQIPGDLFFDQVSISGRGS